MRTIPLTKGYVAQVDDADYEALAQYNWQVRISGLSRYAQRIVRVPGGRVGIQMHRLLAEAKPGELVDHRDGDGLNNQRANLRLCDPTLSNGNTRVHSSSRTGYKGVAILTHGRHRNFIYQARLAFRKRFYFLGNYATPEEAARARDLKALELYGEFARLNFPAEAAKQRERAEAQNGEEP